MISYGDRNYGEINVFMTQGDTGITKTILMDFIDEINANVKNHVCSFHKKVIFSKIISRKTFSLTGNCLINE